MKKAIIFDLDGTLLNTIGDLTDSLNALCLELGLAPRSAEDYQPMVGNGLAELLKRALPPIWHSSPEQLRSILQRFIAIYNQRQVNSSEPYPGILELLLQLKVKGIPLGLLSNKAHENALVVVEHFFPNCFRYVLGLRSDAPAKPDPTSALEIAQKFGLEPASFIFVGDSDVDMKTARNAGMFPVGVAWGYQSKEEILRAGAKAIIEEPEDLLELLN